MEEEPKNIKIALIGDAYIVEHIIEFFAFIYKKHIVSEPPINNLVIKRKIKNIEYYNDEVYFEIINAGSLTDPKPQFKDISQDDTAFILVFDKSRKESFEELKNNVDKVKEFSKGKFMAFAATIEGEVGEIPEDFLKWLLDSDLENHTFHIHYDSFNILEMLLLELVEKFRPLYKILKRDVAFESLEFEQNKLEEEKLPELDKEKLNLIETINMVLLCDEKIRSKMNETIMKQSQIFQNFVKLSDSSFSFVMKINEKKQVKLKISKPESFAMESLEFDPVLLMIYTKELKDKSFIYLRNSFKKVEKHFENSIKVLVEWETYFGKNFINDQQKEKKIVFGKKYNAFFDQADLDDASEIKNVLKKIAIKVLKKRYEQEHEHEQEHEYEEQGKIDGKGCLNCC
jgi:hypothetical protein